MQSDLSLSSAPTAQRGAVLVVGLVVLAIMTILGIGSMRGSLLEERMAGNLREQASAFQAAEAGLQAALTEIERQPRPIAANTWGEGSLVQGCKVADRDDAPGCTHLSSVLADWRSAATPIEGLAMDAFGGAELSLVAVQPRIVVEERYIPPLDFEAAAQGRGIHFYTVTALGTGVAGQSERILQTTIAKVYAW